MSRCKAIVRQMAGGMSLATSKCSLKLWSLRSSQSQWPGIARMTEETSCGGYTVFGTATQLRWSSNFRSNNTTPTLIEANSGATKEESENETSDFNFAMGSNLPKLKPHMVQRRLSDLRTYEGSQKQIRHSPWRLNLVCQLAARCATLEESMQQVANCGKQKSKGLVMKVLQRTSNLADIRDGVQVSQLEVVECFATQGRHMARMKIMGKGRTGKMHHKHSNMRVVLREIDFPLKVYQAPTMFEKRLWLDRYKRARSQFEIASQQRAELEMLEKAAKEKQEEERGKK